MVRRSLHLVFIAATLASGCNSLFGIHEGTPRPNCVDRNPEEPLIDDMEDGDGAICGLAGRNGHWFAKGDGTGALTPEQGFEPTKIPDGGRGTSQYAARFTGSGFTDWGALMGFDLNLGGQAYDARPANGIKFWMKSDAPVTVSLPIPDTIRPATGGQCADTASTSNCDNQFHFEITAPSVDWVEYEVPFEALSQFAGGSATWNPRLLSVIQFNVPPGAAFDVWVDDVRFYFLCPSSSGCKPTCADPAFPVGCPSTDRDPAGCRPPGTDCAAAATWCADPLVIDDMEDGDSAICRSGGRMGSWYASGDGTSSDLTPRDGANFLQTKIPGGRGTSRYAARITGSGFTDFGALMGMGPGAGHPYDASWASGLTFWMKSNVPVSVSFPTLETDPLSQGGQCAEGEYLCNNRFAFHITAPPNEWTQYRVPFAALTQNAGSATWQPSHLMNIDFAARRNTAFDVWVDDVAFYDCAASGCIPTCTDPAFPVQCPASALSPAGCRRPGTDCDTFVRGCGASNTTVAPPDGLIASFMGASGGSGNDIAGDIFPLGNPGPTTTTTNGALHIAMNAPSASMAQEMFVVDHFKDCVDGTAFTGVQFSISGAISGCTLGYFTEDSVHLFDDGAPYGTHGTARAGIHAASMALTAGQVTPTPQTLRVPFAALLGGWPLRPIDTAKITGVGWAFSIAPSTGGGTPSCVADLTIDDVKFY